MLQVVNLTAMIQINRHTFIQMILPISCCSQGRFTFYWHENLQRTKLGRLMSCFTNIVRELVEVRITPHVDRPVLTY